MAAGVVLLAGMAAWSGVAAIQAGNSQAPVLPLGPGTAPAHTPATRPAPTTRNAPAKPSADAGDTLSRVETPMADRVAVLGLLNKRNGVSRDLVLKPGQGVRVGDIVVRLRACETTAPWEPEHLTGAFVQVDTQGRDQRWRRIFSGWLYKESPSLNVVEHPIYDVWPKSCAMKFPDIGPDTLIASAVAGGASMSSAKKSPVGKPAGKGAAAASGAPDSASSNKTR